MVVVGNTQAARRRARPRVLAGLALAAVAAAVVVLVTDPFASPSRAASGVADNSTPTSLATVTRQALSSQTQVSGTLGYAHASSIRLPAGTPPSAVQQARQSLANSQGMLASARATLSADAATLAEAQATLAAAHQKQALDCAGAGAAESPSDSSPRGEASPSSSPAGTGTCSSDIQALAAAEQAQRGDAVKVQGDHRSLASAQASLAGAEAALSTASSSAAFYGQDSTFTTLPLVGHIASRGQSLFQIDGQSVLLLYGSLIATRAFLPGMSPGPDVAELNANLRALGYDTQLGENFTAASSAAIRALQSARGLQPTGELLLGSVLFEPGAVRVTSVAPATGAPVTPGPVLGITSTEREVKIALDAAQQASVKAGDAVTITLPSNLTTPGVVRSVGTVATSPSSKGAEEPGGESGPTIEVDIAPSDPRATGHLDQAPVTVAITTASVPNALVVPVDALLALAGGGYAVEVAEGAAHHLVAVTIGLFDDAAGLVQVNGPALRAGQRVVVPTA